MNKYKNLTVTNIIIGLCVLFYIITTLLYGIEMNAYDAIEFLGYNPLVVYSDSSYYRLITANFIHFGILHIVVNCYSLNNIGPFVERVLGIKDYLLVIISSMLSTTVIPYIMFLINGYGYNSVSGGISGVICGLLGSIAAMALLYKGQFKEVFRSILPSLLLMIFMSVSFDDISLSGHICGMFGGFVSTYIILKMKLMKRNHVIN